MKHLSDLTRRVPGSNGSTRGLKLGHNDGLSYFLTEITFSAVFQENESAKKLRLSHLAKIKKKMSFSVSLVCGINWYGINRDFVEELMEKQSATSAVGDKKAVVILLYKEKKFQYLYLYVGIEKNC